MVYILGSINMDIVANVAAMPRAGETLTAQSFFVNPGGKGANQAVAVGKLGGKVRMIGKVGTDAYAQPMLQNLRDAGVDTRFVTQAEGTSGVAMIIVEGGENRIILDTGANHKLTTADVDEGLAEAAAGDVLLMQLEVPLDVVEYALRVGKQKGMITILNPAPAVPLSDELLSNVDVISPNETETEILTGVQPRDVVHVALAVKKLYQKGVKHVIITMGGRGSAVSHGQNITEIPSRKVQVVDTTAAGDTFVGTVALKLADGVDIVEACRFATAASAITIQRKGAAVSIPTLAEVEASYKKA